jgi:hypothetical protein
MSFWGCFFIHFSCRGRFSACVSGLFMRPDITVWASAAASHAVDVWVRRDDSLPVCYVSSCYCICCICVLFRGHEEDAHVAVYVSSLSPLNSLPVCHTCPQYYCISYMCLEVEAIWTLRHVTRVTSKFVDARNRVECSKVSSVDPCWVLEQCQRTWEWAIRPYHLSYEAISYVWARRDFSPQEKRKRTFRLFSFAHFFYNEKSVLDLFARVTPARRQQHRFIYATSPYAFNHMTIVWVPIDFYVYVYLLHLPIDMTSMAQMHMHADACRIFFCLLGDDLSRSLISLSCLISPGNREPRHYSLLSELKCLFLLRAAEPFAALLHLCCSCCISYSRHWSVSFS